MISDSSIRMMVAVLGFAVVGCTDPTETPESTAREGTDNPLSPESAGPTGAGDPDVFCSDGLDNDNNGLTDCCDPSCVESETTVCLPGTTAEDTADTCFDCIDNDSDGFVDCGDFSCSMNNPAVECPSEGTDELCSDRIDNDDNGFTDCNDFGCSMNPDVTVCD